MLNNVPGVKTPEATIRDHVGYLRRLDREGALVMCGPFTDHAGGLVIVKAASKEDAARIAEADPFVKSGVRSFEVRTWELSCEENNHLGMG